MATLPMRRSAALLAAVGLLVAGPPPAAADPSRSVPSAGEVSASRQAAETRADAVGRIEARLAEAGARSDLLAAQVGLAVEAYNGSRLRLVAAEARARDARARLRAADAAVEVSREALGRFAAAAYRSGGDVGGLSVFLVAEGPRDLISRAAALQAVGSSRRHALDDLRAAQVHADLLRARSRGLVRERERAARRVARSRDAARARLSSHEQAVAEISAERETLIRELAAARDTTVRLERARQAGLERRRAAAARRAAQARALEEARAAEARAAEAERRAAADRAAQDAARQAETARRADEQRAAEQRAAEQRAAEQRRAEDGRATGGDRPDPAPEPAPEPAPAPAPPPPSAGSSSGTSNGADRAIAFARAQIGKPYQWGADGPGSYDCSGLTMRAWEQGGVALPHFSVAQYERSAKVPLADLRPGDLVFFGTDPANHRSIYHVGLYVGDGQMIEAPYTGESVRVSSIWRGSLVGAARP